MRTSLLILATVLASQNALAQEARKPNVVVFLIDDLGCADLGIDGSSFHETPNLDALARSGVRFTNFYSAHPVCSPTRASLMTGKVPQRVGITDWIHPKSGVALPGAEITLGEAFQAHGYRTGYVGKWHLGESLADHPTRHGFSWTRGVNRAGQPASYDYPFKSKADASTVYDVPDFENGQAGDYLTDVLTTAAIEFVEKPDATRPFFLCFGHYAVHTPIQPPKDLPAKYRAKRSRRYGDEPTPTLPAPHNATSRARQDDPAYAAMVENLDRNVGRVLGALDRSGQRENTIVVFTSDNGGLCTNAGPSPGPTCNLPSRSGKGWTYEGGIRVTASIAWPSHLEPRTVDVPAFTADLYPTLLDLCGFPLDPRQHVDGRSLANEMRGKRDPSVRDRSLAWFYPHNHASGHTPSAAIRRGSWKLLYDLTAKTSQLYDLSVDPCESHDLARDRPEALVPLRDELLAWIAETTHTP